jgi:hypothetical protein
MKMFRNPEGVDLDVKQSIANGCVQPAEPWRMNSCTDSHDHKPSMQTKTSGQLSMDGIKTEPCGDCYDTAETFLSEDQDICKEEPPDDESSVETEMNYQSNEHEFEDSGLPEVKIKIEPADMTDELHANIKTEQAEIKYESSEHDGFEDSCIPGEVKIEMEPADMTDDINIKTESADDYDVAAGSSVSAQMMPPQIPAGMTLDTDTGNSSCNWEGMGGESKVVPIILIPAAGRGQLRINVEDTLHPVQSGTVKVEADDDVEDLESLDAEVRGRGFNSLRFVTNTTGLLGQGPN